MTDAEILDAIERVCARGGSVEVEATDPLNPTRNYQARVTLATPWRATGCESWLVGGETARETLANALGKVPR